MKKVYIKYGLIGGVALMVLGFGQWFLFQDKLSYRQSEVVGYTSILLALSSIYFAIRKYRAELDGQISFGTAFKVGLLTALIPSAFMFVQTIIFFVAFGDEFLQWAEAEMAKLPPEEYLAYQQQMESMGEWMQNPFFQGLIMFLTVFVMGIGVSVVSALMLKTKEGHR